VVRIARRGDALAVFSTVPDGVSLSEVLAALEFRTISVSGEELLELASSVVTALSTVHERMPSIAHGALTPAHIVVQPDGSTVLTGAVYADALQALQKNREHLWRDFGLALPTAANFPRFDQRETSHSSAPSCWRSPSGARCGVTSTPGALTTSRCRSA
jgi:hypothetical protein